MKCAVIIDCSGSMEGWSSVVEKIYKGLQEKLLEHPSHWSVTVWFRSTNVNERRSLNDGIYGIAYHLKHANGGLSGYEIKEIQSKYHYDLIFIITDGGIDAFPSDFSRENVVFVTDSKHKERVRVLNYQKIPLLIIDKIPRTVKVLRWVIRKVFSAMIWIHANQ